MTVTSTPTMLADFPHWYASLGLGDDQAHRQLRWNGVGAIAAEASAATIEALLRLAFNTKQRPHEEAVTAFRHAIRQADPTAPPTGNDRELEILAASALAAIMSAGGLSGARAAMGITTTAGNGRREPSLPMDLPTLANAQLTIIARGIRQRTPIVISAASEVTFSLDDAAAKAKEGNFEAASQAFTIAATEIQKSLQTLANRQVKLVHTLNQTLRLQDEELNMLWWLTGGFSFDLHKPFHDVAALSRPLVFAKELADLTAFAPGPATATALFTRRAYRCDMLDRQRREYDPDTAIAATCPHAATVARFNTDPLCDPSSGRNRAWRRVACRMVRRNRTRPANQDVLSDDGHALLPRTSTTSPGQIVPTIHGHNYSCLLEPGLRRRGHKALR